MRLAVLLSLFVASPALADVCELPGRGMTPGPIQASLESGELAVARRPCPRTEVGIAGRGRAILAPSDFYGDVTVSGDLFASVSLLDLAELFANIEVLRFETAISSVSGTSFGLGHASLGFSVRSLYTERVAIAFYGRAVLPTATDLYVNARPLSLDAGLSALLMISRRLRLHGALALVGQTAITDADADPALGFAATLGASFLVGRVYLPALELRVQAGRDGLDLVGVAASFALTFGDFTIDPSVVLPVAGAERALAGASIRASLRF